MSHITTCTACGHAYEEASEETANAPGNLCGFCFDDAKALLNSTWERRYPQEVAADPEIDDLPPLNFHSHHDIKGAM